MAELSDYLKSKGVTVTDFARAIDRSRVSVSRMLSGKQNPGPETLRAIHKETGGLVTANDFVHPTKVPASQTAE